MTEPKLTNQQRRVLRWAERTGRVCTEDFMAPLVVDQGPVITRVPARIGELKKLGYLFERDGTRDGFAVWKLHADVPAPAPVEVEPPVEPGVLFTLPKPTHYQDAA